MDKVKTGIDGLDSMMDGGLPPKTVHLLSGGPGTGKTLMALKFLLEGAKSGEKCVFISLNETREELVRASKGIRELNDLEDYLGKNLDIQSVILGNNVSVGYFTKVFIEYPDVDRVVIDNVNKLLMFSSSIQEYRKHLEELIRYLKRKSRSTLLLCETQDGKIDQGTGEAYECDGMIHLEFLDLEEVPLRTLQIHKMRYTKIEPLVHRELMISDKSIKVSKKKII